MGVFSWLNKEKWEKDIEKIIDADEQRLEAMSERLSLMNKTLQARINDAQNSLEEAKRDQNNKKTHLTKASSAIKTLFLQVHRDMKELRDLAKETKRIEKEIVKEENKPTVKLVILKGRIQEKELTGNVYCIGRQGVYLGPTDSGRQIWEINLNNKLSAGHFAIQLLGNQIKLRQIGRNPTTISVEKGKKRTVMMQEGNEITTEYNTRHVCKINGETVLEFLISKQ